MTDDDRIEVRVTVPAAFVERLNRNYPEGLNRSERLRMAAADGVAERESQLTEQGMVRAIQRALEDEVVAVHPEDLE